MKNKQTWLDSEGKFYKWVPISRSYSFPLSWFTKSTLACTIHIFKVLFLTLRVPRLYILQLLAFDFLMHLLHTFPYILDYSFKLLINYKEANNLKVEKPHGHHLNQDTNETDNRCLLIGCTKHTIYSLWFFCQKCITWINNGKTRGQTQIGDHSMQLLDHTPHTANNLKNQEAKD